MTTDSTEAAFDWGESDDALVLGDEREVRSGERRAKTQNPVMLAVFGGLYAVWSVAWVLGVVAAPTQQASSVLDAVMFQFGEFLGMVAAPLWFGVVWWLTSASSAATRLILLVTGLIVLLPLSLILPVVAS
jgi:hypothetical protein